MKKIVIIILTFIMCITPLTIKASNNIVDDSTNNQSRYYYKDVDYYQHDYYYSYIFNVEDLESYIMEIHSNQYRLGIYIVYDNVLDNNIPCSNYNYFVYEYFSSSSRNEIYDDESTFSSKLKTNYCVYRNYPNNSDIQSIKSYMYNLYNSCVDYSLFVYTDDSPNIYIYSLVPFYIIFEFNYIQNEAFINDKYNNQFFTELLYNPSNTIINTEIVKFSYPEIIEQKNLLGVANKLINLMVYGDYQSNKEFIKDLDTLTNTEFKNAITQPNYILSWLFYILCGFGIIFLLIIVPYRLIKKILPKRGKR